MNFPGTIPVKSIDAKASEYLQYAAAWQTFADLNEGGSVLRDAVVQSGKYLLKKPKEPGEVYATRQQRFSYTNLMGNITGWYNAALFKTPPQLIKKPAGAAATADAKLGQDADAYCAAFEKDADRAGTSYIDFWRKVAEALVLYRSAYVLLDLPAPEPSAPAPASLAEQQSLGQLDPYLVLYPPSQMLNWETDRYGNLAWCIIGVTIEERVPFAAPVVMDYWYYFDTQEVACYQAKRPDQGQRGDADTAQLVAGYPRRHAMADQNRIPVRKVEVADGLWLANRVYLPLLNHLNLDNAFDFGLFQSALAQLVVIGDYDDAVTMSEVSYLRIPSGGDIKYLEPAGAAYNAIDTRLQALEERIYKACYLLDQARTNRSTPAAQSGVSKQQDKTPSRDALSALGDVLRPAMQAVYADALAVRGFGDVVPDVRGLDFRDKAGVEEMDFLEKSTVIDIQSDTYRRERDKMFVRAVLSDANPETLTKIDAEIDQNPTPEGAAALAQEQANAQQLDRFSQSFQAAEQVTQ